ncbi:helix-turn-helix domain-containing protein [Virgibacillus salexigens]|uniref:HTH cro/C1-type domain-containing protein n=1 Tax=Virgibacillus kapii TaxID=1638645 RepID=A0ABQ2DL07_9BACI|nr:helix-turn-helix transcriptional regulator [Virgibacillus kapii]GGJ62155.1 hypothetical protein GCM10007111_25350 [Virgibacillus kapii]
MKSLINEQIEKRGYKKKWVSQELGVSQEVLSRWVNGKSMPSVENLFKLAELLDCKVDDLYEKVDKK